MIITSTLGEQDPNLLMGFFMNKRLKTVPIVLYHDTKELEIKKTIVIYYNN